MAKRFDELVFLKEIEEKKARGNDLFKERKFDEAINVYLDALNDIEYAREKDLRYETTLVKLEELEISCRLNCSQGSVNLGQYDLAINEALKVNKIKENHKAHYKLGQCHLMKKNFQRAINHFEKGYELAKGEQEKDEFLKKIVDCKEFMAEESSHQKAEVDSKRSRMFDNYSNDRLERNEEDVVIEEKEEETNTQKNSKDVIKSMLKKEEKVLKSEKLNKKSNPTTSSKIEVSSSTRSNHSHSHDNGHRCDQHKNFSTHDHTHLSEKEYEELLQFKGQSKDEFEKMKESINKLDPATLKKLMQMDGGEDITDEEIERCKRNLDYDHAQKALKNLEKMKRESNKQKTEMKESSSTQSGGMPNMAEMMKMAQQMRGENGQFDFSKMMSNPAMMNMVKNFSGGSKDGKGNERMMKNFDNVIWLCSMCQKAFSFLFSLKGLCLVLFLYWYFFYSRRGENLQAPPHHVDLSSQFHPEEDIYDASYNAAADDL